MAMPGRFDFELVVHYTGHRREGWFLRAQLTVGAVNSDALLDRRRQVGRLGRIGGGGEGAGSERHPCQETMDMGHHGENLHGREISGGGGCESQDSPRKTAAHLDIPAR